jgi:hypothetical protein
MFIPVKINGIIEDKKKKHHKQHHQKKRIFAGKIWQQFCQYIQ